MTNYSLNGWPAPPKIRVTLPIPGCPNRRLTMESICSPLLLAVAADYHRWVAPLDAKGSSWDEGCFNYRQANGATGRWSNHASGTAIDLNWSKEGAQGSAYGKAFFAKLEKKLAIARIKKIYGDVIFWGGDWNAKDYMHFEIKPGTSALKVKDLIKFLDIDSRGVRHNNWRGKPLPANQVIKM